MVWLLLAEGRTDLGPFYFTAPGTYTVGRKDCTITIQTDKTISRVHAEISVEAVPLGRPLKKDDDSLPKSTILLKDLSKFGTFVNKDLESKPLNSQPSNTAVLKEGDTITFGTNKAVFRLQFIPLVLCMSPLAYREDNNVRSSAEALGVDIFEQWNSQCTHLLVEDGSLVTDLVVEAVISKKPVLSLQWLQALISEHSPSNQLPNFLRYIPTLKISIRGLVLPVTIVEPIARQETLGVYTVLMENGGMYHCSDLFGLVNAAGGAVKVFTPDNIKDVAGSVQQNGLLLFPSGKSSRKDWLGSKLLPFIQHLHPISEEDLLRGILTSKLDLTAANCSPVASADSDETAEEDDYQLEEDSALSVPQEVNQIADLLLAPFGQSLNSKKESAVMDSGKKESVFIDSSNKEFVVIDTGETKSVVMEESRAKFRAFSVRPADSIDSFKTLENSKPRSSRGVASIKEFVQARTVVETVMKQPCNVTDAEHSIMPLTRMKQDLVQSIEYQPEVIFNNGLVVRKNWTMSPVDSLGGALPNFKRFRKGVAACGNNFSSLVPFAKEPYRESNYGREMDDYVKEEKKRKEAELLAEDLFNTEQLKRRRVTAADATKSGLSTLKSRKNT